jgi:hypothetical protein
MPAGTRHSRRVDLDSPEPRPTEPFGVLHRAMKGGTGEVRGRHDCPGRRFRRPEQLMPWTTSRDQVEQPADAHTGRGTATCMCVQTCRHSVKVGGSLAKTARGTMTKKYGIPGVDGHRGRSECRTEKSIARRGWSGNATTLVARQRGGAAAIQGHRHARCAPGKAGPPAEITASADHRRPSKDVE